MLSTVRAFFTVSKHSTKSSFLSPFTCDVFEGVIEPMKKLNLPVSRMFLTLLKLLFFLYKQIHYTKLFDF